MQLSCLSVGCSGILLGARSFGPKCQRQRRKQRHYRGFQYIRDGALGGRADDPRGRQTGRLFLEQVQPHAGFSSEQKTFLAIGLGFSREQKMMSDSWDPAPQQLTPIL